MQAFSITSFVGSAASAWFETVQTSTERAVENFMEITESVDQFVTSHLDEQTGGFLGPQQDPATRPYRTERLHKERHGGARPAVRSDNGAEHAVAPAGAWDDFSIDGSEVRRRRIYAAVACGPWVHRTGEGQEHTRLCVLRVSVHAGQRRLGSGVGG